MRPHRILFLFLGTIVLAAPVSFAEEGAPPLFSLRLNEFLANNQNGLRDEDGSRQDWIEIYNPTPVAVDLQGCLLTDDKARLNQWRFPSFVVGAQSYVIVWASNKNRTNTLPLHTNFRLDAQGIPRAG
jgi:hypothetical protein